MDPIDPANGSGGLDTLQGNLGQNPQFVDDECVNEKTEKKSEMAGEKESSVLYSSNSNSDLCSQIISDRTVMETISTPDGGMERVNFTNEEMDDVGDQGEISMRTIEKHNSLRTTVKQFVVTIIPPGGVLASAFNVAACTIGAGILGMPAATNKSGLVMALVYLIVITFFTIYSMRALVIASERTQIRNFEGVGRALLGPWCAYLCAAVRTLQSLSGCVAYVISVGDIISTIIKHTSSTPEFLRTTAGNRLLTALVWLFAMLPLVIPKHIDSLRYLSTFAVLFMVYFVIVLIVHSCMNGLPDNSRSIRVSNGNDAELVLFNTGNVAIEALGVFLFAFVCQINAYEVYWDMSDRTVSKFTLASVLGMMLCFLLYAMTSCFAYLDFGREVTNSVLIMYNPIKDKQMMVGFVGVLVKLCCSFALLTMACRNSLYDIIGWDVDKLPYWKHSIVVVILSTIMLFLGMFIPKITIVLGFVGPITGGSMGFILPALFVMYSGDWNLKKVGIFNYLCTYALLLCGVIVVVFGEGGTIYSTAIGD